MRYCINFIVLGLTLAACADNSHKDTASSVPQKTDNPTIDTAKSAVADFQKMPMNNDTLFVDRQAAVFIRPDSLRIEQEKKKGREEDFYVGANDYLYYMSAAQEFLGSVNLKVVDVDDKKFIRFVGSEKKHQIITINNLPELWSIYFFDPAKKAKQVDMTVIEEEYKAYFK